MKTRITIVAAALAACLPSVAPVQAQTSAATQDGTVSLFHRFTIPPKVAFGPISVEVAPGGWRVGALDGPLATDAQLRAVLSRLTTLEVGGRCAGWVEKATSYPCGFAIADLDFGGAVEPLFSAITTDWHHATDEPAQANPVLERSASPGLAAHGLMLMSPVLDAERFVALRAPLRYLGDKSCTLGARITFRFRAVTNALVPSEFNRASGAVVLRADPRVQIESERESERDEERKPRAGSST